MPSLRTCLIACLLAAIPLPSLAAQEKKDGKSVEQLVKDVKESIAVILYTGRDGKQQGLGTGFVISEDGLIATNLPVIGPFVRGFICSKLGNQGSLR